MAQPFRKVLESGKFVVTAEIGPVKGTNIQKMIDDIELLKPEVDALNVTDNQSAVMKYPSLGGCLLIEERDGEPVLQVTCRDRNRLSIQADLLFAFSRGIENVLCITGDTLKTGDHPEAKPVYDIDSVQLIQLIHVLNSGRDLSGNELNGGVDFCIGAAATPSVNPVEPQLIKYKKKLKAGIDFVQTQAVYELDDLKKFVEHSRSIDKNVKILAGIVLLSGAGMAKWLNENIPGIFVPGNLIDELAEAPKGEGLSKGIEIAGGLIKKIKDEKICDGVHIMAIGREEKVIDILKAAGISGGEK
ncbi:MAG: methylenetetrahydrofolate reductase [Actinomycetota bacterium]|nr:methylenetetrahydrofolate reductase [Actinomycetota bacterium]